MRPLIGIIGFMDSGKGTVGDYLHERWGFNKHAFASKVKDACSVIFNWPRPLLEGDTKESREWRETNQPFWAEQLGRETFTPREAMQLMGTEAGRNVFGSDLWVASTMGSIVLSASRMHVITDTRFLNEIKAIKREDGIIVRVKRGKEPIYYNDACCNPEDVMDIADRNDWMRRCLPEIHQSEWDWIGSTPDWVIENDGSLADLKSKVDDMITHYFPKWSK